jgi:HD-like signal output (HDOD) protein
MDAYPGKLMNMDHPAPPPSLDRLLYQSISSIDIPPRPRIIDRIRDAMNEAAPNLRQVGQLISRDVSLAAGLIKTANSPYFGYQNRARSVQDALAMLGLDATSRAVASISLRLAFPECTGYERFWDASARIAALSGWLVQRLGKPGLRADDAYTFGLFRDCGIVILLRRFPAYRGTLARANDCAEQAFTVVEHADFPTDHTMLGSLLARDWWLPDEICQAIRHHHDRNAIDLFESGLPLASRQLIAFSQTAERLLQRIRGGSHTREWEKLGASCRRLLNLEEVELAALEEEAGILLRTIE